MPSLKLGLDLDPWLLVKDALENLPGSRLHTVPSYRYLKRRLDVFRSLLARAKSAGCPYFLMCLANPFSLDFLSILTITSGQA
jgi:hypothetical protein